MQFAKRGRGARKSPNSREAASSVWWARNQLGGQVSCLQLQGASSAIYACTCTKPPSGHTVHEPAYFPNIHRECIGRLINRVFGLMKELVHRPLTLHLFLFGSCNRMGRSIVTSLGNYFSVSLITLRSLLSACKNCLRNMRNT